MNTAYYRTITPKSIKRTESNNTFTNTPRKRYTMSKFSASKLFEPLQLGRKLRIKHRVVMAPLTRCRASHPSLAPHAEEVAEYYRQRASDGGLLVTEAVNISAEAVGEPGTPGIWTDEQTEAWSRIAQAVHSKNGLVSMQLWHTGRMGTSRLDMLLSQPLVAEAEFKPSVSSSATPLVSKRRTIPAPRPLTVPDMDRIVSDYRKAARNAMKAGFDCVELHAAHGYLLDQFLCDGVNKRTDEFGGSIENRIRFPIRVVQALVDEIGSDRVAVRLSPTTKDSMTYQQATDSNPEKVYTEFVQRLDSFDLAYLMLSEPRWLGEEANFKDDPGSLLPLFHPKTYRPLYRGAIVGAGGFTPSTARDAVDTDSYDAIAFGRWFISNPDIVERLRTGASLNRYDRTTFYTYPETVGDGYTDYPDINGTIGVPSKYPLVEQAAIGKSLKSSKL